MLTIAQWLDARMPPPPPMLMDRMRDVIAPALTRDTSEMPAVALDGAVQLLQLICQRGCIERSDALDLLASDALITYAFEAASEVPEQIVGMTEVAMRRVVEAVHL